MIDETTIASLRLLARGWRARSLLQGGGIARTACVFMSTRLETLIREIETTLSESDELNADLKEQGT